MQRAFQERGSEGGTSLAVQWLGLCASTAGVTGQIPHAARSGQKKKKRKERGNDSLWKMLLRVQGRQGMKIDNWIWPRGDDRWFYKNNFSEFVET